MFEPAEVGAKLSDKDFTKLRGPLRLDLIELQQRLRAADFPVIVTVTGIPGAGVVDTLNLLNSWMDPRWIATTVFDTPTDEERQHPLFWRYWRSLPKTGTIGLYLDGWFGYPLQAFAAGRFARAAYVERLHRLAGFERMLADDGALILKFWLHLKKQSARKPEPTARDPLVGLRPTDTSLAPVGSYDRLIAGATLAIETTMTGAAPWHIVEGTDDNHRRATVLALLREALRHHLKARKKGAKHMNAAKAREKRGKHRHELLAAHVSDRNVLDTVDLDRSLSRGAYRRKFADLQQRIYQSHKRARELGMASVLAFEGWDAAGKGGTIRRLSYCLNARNYRIVPVAAPTEDERAHHYLWRFWRGLQRDGRVTIYDRSWYGRVLVERVERLADEDTWMRAYSEINAFENELIGHGTLVLKFWLHLDRETQLLRYKERRKTPYKRWKLNDEDWRNREHWEAYEEAVNDMVAYTSRPQAPWHLIPANDKHYARIAVLEIFATALERAVAARPKGTGKSR